MIKILQYIGAFVKTLVDIVLMRAFAPGRPRPENIFQAA
jgi:hypothetical protein